VSLPLGATRITPVPAWAWDKLGIRLPASKKVRIKRALRVIGFVSAAQLNKVVFGIAIKYLLFHTNSLNFDSAGVIFT
jgi:hypothetical protein